MKTKAHILVADDNPLSVKTLQSKLLVEGFRISIARNGKECLDIARKDKPDLILMDVIMPQLGGFETLTQLQESPQFSSIPVIFITSRNDRKTKLIGLDSGAIDFLTKPIDFDETIAKIRTHLRLQDLHRENTNLTHRLSEARREASLKAFASGVAHNLNNLMAVAQGYLEILGESPKMGPEEVCAIRSAESAMSQIESLVSRIGNMTAEANPDLFPVDVKNLLIHSIERFQEDNEISEANIEIQCHTPKGLKIQTNEESFEMILGRLLSNAWEAYVEQVPLAKRRILVQAFLLYDKPALLLRIKDWGTGISNEIKSNLVEPFITTKNKLGRGLGLTIAKYALRGFSAELKFSSPSAGGTEVDIIYPL